MFETLCNNCNHKNCCTDSAAPLVFSRELQKIRQVDPQYVKHIKTIKINGKQVKTIKKKSNSTECIFWDGKTGGCTIYESRPIDCRLYPFDILYVGDSYHWIVYSCNEKSDWNWSENYLKSLESDDGFDDLMKNIHFFSENTKRILPSESKKTPYEVLRKVRWNNN